MNRYDYIVLLHFYFFFKTIFDLFAYDNPLFSFYCIVFNVLQDLYFIFKIENQKIEKFGFFPKSFGF